ARAVLVRRHRHDGRRDRRGRRRRPARHRGRARGPARRADPDRPRPPPPLGRPSVSARSLVAYLSGHGFGHFTRSEAVLAPLAARGVRVHVRTNGIALALAARATWARSVEEVDVGPGLVQDGPFDVDLAATAASLRAHLAAAEDVARREARAARDLG